MPTITTLSTTLAYNQWVEPKAIQCGTKMYYTGIKSSNGYPYVKMMDSSYNISTALLENGLEVDDHNAPAVLARPGKKVLAAWARHNASAVMNFHMADEGTVNFVDQGNLGYGSNITYAQFLDYGNNVWLFCRNGSGRWGFKKSTGWPTSAASWGSEVNFLQFTNGNPYPIFRESSTPGIWHVAIAPNPDNPTSYLKYGTINLSNGDISSGGSVIGNLSGTNLPLDENDFEELDPTNRSDQHIRLWDVTDLHDKVIICYDKWEEDSTTGNEGRLMFAVGEPTAWEHKDIWVGQGQVFYDPDGSHYSGGMAFGRNGGDDLFVAYESDNTWYLVHHVVDTNFNLNSGTVLHSSPNSTAKIIRPVAVQGRDAVMAMQVSQYTSYQNLTSSTFLVDL